MAERNLPSIDYLRQRLDYEPDTGKLRWRAHPDMPPQWNARYSGTEAGAVNPVHGYRSVSVDRKLIRAHRIVWAIVHGAWPTADVDHVNHDRLDNRLANLRQASRADNSRNASLSRRNTSGVTGVCWDKKRNRWLAQIHPNRRCVNLGLFANFDDAVAARKEAERRFGFHENHGIGRRATEG